MTLSAETTGTSKLSNIIDRLSAQRQGDLAARFARELFSEVDAVEFASYDANDLVTFALEAFETFAVRKSGQPKIALREHETDGHRFLLVDIVNDDMPFILDSVLGELREMTLVPELVAHPIFEARRDENGALTALEPAAPVKNGALRESFIHLHIRETGREPALAVIEEALTRMLAQVRTVVADYQPMLDRLNEAIARFEKSPPPATVETNAESVQFLRWLAANNFTFLGIREYAYVGNADAGVLIPQPELNLGLLREPDMMVLRRGGEEAVVLTPESRAFFLNSPPVVVANGNSKSTVHRHVYMDTVGVKLYGEDGRIAGEMRIAGLFAASAYHLSTRNIPLLRLKTDQVLRRSGHAPDSYSGRALLNVLEAFPRDELFQTSVDQLCRISEEILKVEFTPRPRVFVRRDEFGRFVSVFVYVPRESYATDVRVAIVNMLENAFDGRFEAFTPFFPESPMVRIHFLIWRKTGVELKDAPEAALEKEVERIIRTWADEFRDHILQHFGGAGYALVGKYLHAFPAGYQETNRPARALEDIQRLEKLGSNRPTDIDIYRPLKCPPGSLRATLQQLDEPITLSKRVPILENFGFNVISERTFRLTPKLEGEPRSVYLHDSELQLANGGETNLLARRAKLEEGFLAVWGNLAEDDRFNGLILSAGLSWREAALIRAYAHYFRQSGAPYGQLYLAQVLNKHGGVVASLFTMFDTMFNPAADFDAPRREEERAKIAERIAGKLDAIPVLDEDRILRSLLKLIEATLRTNFYHRGETGAPPETIAFKLRSRQIEWLPEPKPFAEIFVYSPRFEGVHLRGGAIARGGLRWSDRPQDFRTEVLGLAKAQQVKNVVIVPQGAKGGFVPRKLPKGDREAIQAEGVACYKSFVSSLLSITDNLVKGEVAPPDRTIRRDGDDPYLVVAADKGTATFSDIANEIAQSRGFWLGDAFASGGSVGYDHKKMAITARGAWEAVRRHFREMNMDIQSTPFTVVGVGDMSGDVFGNGMLLSKATKLVAAFDHRDIFIDPDPDTASSWEERKRLYELPRSSWQDYDRAKLSAGGGIYSRGEKYIALSERARQLLCLGDRVTPSEVMTAILKAKADLLWFGGIGTFVRASAESDAQVGDKTNDAIRITARDIGAKVVGEGANLGMTQRARIEFGLAGGRSNTDAIDNSAGVNTSDVEVNLKIALGAAVSAGKIDVEERNRLLAAMTEEVAASVLRNNYLQTLAISLDERRGLPDLGFQRRMIQKLEKEGALDRALETLPTDAELHERAVAGKPLTRPELAVLLAYAKIDLEKRLIESTVPDDPYLGRALFAYFPPLMRERFASEIASHPLRREIIATSLTNEIVNRGGSNFVVRLVEETGYEPSDIAAAFAAATAVYELDKLYAGIDALDGKIDGQKQLALYRSVQDLLREQTAWFLRHGQTAEGLEPEIAQYRDGVEFLFTHMAAILHADGQERLRERTKRLVEDGAPEELAQRLASLEPLSQALDIVRVANRTGATIPAAAKMIFAIRDTFRLDELTAASEALIAGDYFDRLAVNSSLAAVAAAQRGLAYSIVGSHPDTASFEAWLGANKNVAERVSRGLGEILDSGGLTLAKLTVAVSHLRDLAGG